LVAHAKAHRPDLIAAKTDIQTADAALRSARAGGMPTLSLTSGITGVDTALTSPTTNTNVGVVLSIPLFTGYATTYKIAAATAQRSLKESVANATEKQVALEVYTAYTNLLAADKKVQLTDDLLTSAQASYRSALGRYKAGVGTILDVTTAQSLLSSAQQQKVASQYTLSIARVALTKALGDNEATTSKEHP
jgi:outer membrane protein TolC